jgi:hypothetical protein
VSSLRIFDCDQGSEEWFTARLGIPTASEFSTVMAKGEGKTRRKYLLRLAGEIVTGEPEETYTNAHMERGKLMEDEARKMYAFLHDSPCQRVGFIRNGAMGCSPDSLIGEDGGLEIKTAIGSVQVDRLLRGDLPSDHKAQVQGNMLVTGRKWWDFVSYSPKLPLFRVRVVRDEAYINNLKAEIDTFNRDLEAVVESVRRYTDRDEIAA